MAEAFAGIDLVSAVVQFVDFGVKIVDRLNKFYSKIKNILKVFRDIKNELPLLLNIFKRIKAQAAIGHVSGDTQKTLLSVV
jgi:hypothetical protein